MNIFIIPSWYPTKVEPVNGIFVKEQAEALAENFPGSNFIISHCENFYLSVTKPAELIKVFKFFSKSKAEEIKIKPNLFEFYNPAVTYSEKLGGEINNIVKAHSENFKHALNKFGKIDIIHAHVSYPAGYAAMKLKNKFKVPYIITEHMGPFPFDIFIVDGKISDKISEPLSNANGIIAVSKYLSEKINSFGIKGSVVIPNMVNEELFYPVKKEKNSDAVNFLTVSALIESKGIKELLDAILLSGKTSSNKFIIAGNGPLGNFADEFILKNNLSQKVILIRNPSRHSLIKLFQECDAFILPSRLESFGIVYVESMACGKPVIATDSGGPADFVNSETGILVSSENIMEIENAILSMTENIHSYNPEAIRKFFLENFSRKVVCSEIFSLYKEVIKSDA